MTKTKKELYWEYVTYRINNLQDYVCYSQFTNKLKQMTLEQIKQDNYWSWWYNKWMTFDRKLTQNQLEDIKDDIRDWYLIKDICASYNVSASYLAYYWIDKKSVI